ncbi:MAG: hypothetical protein JOY60_01895 [Burkholderiaceae bacterium]|nr:hypothetical protein [Burkholderiaceae bacterium]
MMNRFWTLLALVVLALVAMVVGDPGLLSTWRAKWDATSHTALPQLGSSAGNATVHKCRSNGGISYSTEKCPRGSTEDTLAPDRVTTVSMPKPALLPATPASLPTVRDLLVNPNEPNLKQMEMDRALNESR